MIILIGLSAPLLCGQKVETDKPVNIEWRPFNINKDSCFPNSIGMINTEREDYANNLAGVAIMQLKANKADKESRDLARRMIALALHLSHTNRRAVVLNGQLGQGTVPEPPETDYRPKTLARLLMKRGQLLEEEEGRMNIELAGYFLSLAVDLDPKSEDAIYHSELHRINHGEPDWTRLLLNKE